MKEIYVKAGLRVAKGLRIKNQKEAVDFCEKIGFPVVVKPDIGVGAVSTYKINNLEELEAIEMKEGYFVEEFIEGKIVTFDGFVDINGNVVFCQSHEYSHGVMDIANNNSHVFYHNYREIPTDLMEIGLKTVKAFDLRERFFHLEFFRCPDNSIVCLEINVRPPGGYTMDMFNFANNLDLYQVYAEFVTGSRTELSYTRDFFVCYISRKNHIRYRYTHEEIMASAFASDIVFNSPLPLGLSLMGDYGYIYRHEHFENVKKFSQFVWEKPDLTEPFSVEWTVSPGPRRLRSLSQEAEKGEKEPLD